MMAPSPWVVISLVLTLTTQATHKILRNPSVASDCNVAVAVLGGYSIQHSQRTLKALSAQIDVCHFHLVLVTYNNTLYQPELAAFHRHLLARPRTSLVIFDSFVPYLNEDNAAFKVAIDQAIAAALAHVACTRKSIPLQHRKLLSLPRESSFVRAPYRTW